MTVLLKNVLTSVQAMESVRKTTSVYVLKAGQVLTVLRNCVLTIVKTMGIVTKESVSVRMAILEWTVSMKPVLRIAMDKASVT
jgi:hypothetical protein